jgi:hypothetical protein
MENDFSINQFKGSKFGDNPKEGDNYGLGFDYKPFFLQGSASYDTLTNSSSYDLSFNIPALEKWRLGVGVNGYDYNYGTNNGTADAAGYNPYISLGYNNSGVSAGVQYQYGQQPQFNINYSKRF